LVLEKYDFQSHRFHLSINNREENKHCYFLKESREAGKRVNCIVMSKNEVEGEGKGFSIQDAKQEDGLARGLLQI
jgi:hypothetical protein